MYGSSRLAVAFQSMFTHPVASPILADTGGPGGVKYQVAPRAPVTKWFRIRQDKSRQRDSPQIHYNFLGAMRHATVI